MTPDTRSPTKTLTTARMIAPAGAVRRGHLHLVTPCTAAQPAGSVNDGTACVVCGLDYLSDPDGTPHKPVGRSVTGSQVFACSDHAGAATS